MIGARVLWVLAQIARRDDGDLRAARVAAYGALDPLVRGLVRSKVQRAVADSEAGDRDLRITSQTGSGKTVAIGLALAAVVAREVLDMIERSP